MEIRDEGVVVRAEDRPDLLAIFVRDLPVAVAMFDREMRCLQASDRWCRDLRVELEQVQGRLHYEVFAIPERWREIHRRGLRGETITEDCDCLSFSETSS